MIIDLGYQKHKAKSDKGDHSLFFHKIISRKILHLSIIGAGAVYHDQTKHGQEYDRKEKAVIVKSAYFFLFRPWSRSLHVLPPVCFRFIRKSNPAYRAFTHSLKIRPRSSKFLNMPQLAHAGERST